MMSPEEIAAMDIADVKLNFYGILETVVTTYQDNRENTSQEQASQEQERGEQA